MRKRKRTMRIHDKSVYKKIKKELIILRAIDNRKLSTQIKAILLISALVLGHCPTHGTQKYTHDAVWGGALAPV
jgi:hypothetical protein